MGEDKFKIAVWSLVMGGMVVLGFLTRGWIDSHYRHPVEVTILQDGADQYSVEIRNVSKKTISIKTTYINDREDTSGIKTYIMGSSGYDCPVDKIRDDMICECETVDKMGGDVDIWPSAAREEYLEPKREEYRQFAETVWRLSGEMRICDREVIPLERVFFPDGRSTTDPEIVWGHYMMLKYQCNFEEGDE